MPHATGPTAVNPYSLPTLHAGLRERAAQVATRFAGRHREVRLHPLEHSEPHPELWAEIKKHGWPGLNVPSPYGGTEGGLLGMAVVQEALAAAGLLQWMSVLSSAIAHAIAEVGPDSAREQWLPRVASGGAYLALAATNRTVVTTCCGYAQPCAATTAASSSTG